MSAKKLQNLFQNKTPSKKGISLASPSKDQVKKKNEKRQNIEDRAIIEGIKEAIQKKLKDPEMAKKAAQIINELLKKK